MLPRVVMEVVDERDTAAALFFFFSFFFLSFFFFVFGGWGWESSCKFSCVFKAFSFLKYDFCPISPAVQTSERIRERERERERGFRF